MKSIFDMSVAEYQKLAKKYEKKYPTNVPLNKIPGLRRVGRHLKGSTHDPLLVRSVKMTLSEWTSLKKMAKVQHMSVGSLIRAYAHSGKGK